MVWFLLDGVAPFKRDTPPTIIDLVTCKILDWQDLGVSTGAKKANILFKMQAIYGF